jgi:hypothetical protein
VVGEEVQVLDAAAVLQDAVPRPGVSWPLSSSSSSRYGFLIVNLPFCQVLDVVVGPVRLDALGHLPEDERRRLGRGDGEQGRVAAAVALEHLRLAVLGGHLGRRRVACLLDRLGDLATLRSLASMLSNGIILLWR